jgi:acyl carrier protein
MNTGDALRGEIKSLLVETLMLQTPVAELADHQPFFGPDSLGLDTVDALQIVVMLDKHFGLKLTDAEAAREVLRSVETMAAAVERLRAAQAQS